MTTAAATHELAEELLHAVHAWLGEGLETKVGCAVVGSVSRYYVSRLVFVPGPAEGGAAVCIRLPTRSRLPSKSFDSHAVVQRMN